MWCAPTNFLPIHRPCFRPVKILFLFPRLFPSLVTIVMLSRRVLHRRSRNTIQQTSSMSILSAVFFMPRRSALHGKNGQATRTKSHRAGLKAILSSFRLKGVSNIRGIDDRHVCTNCRDRVFINLRGEAGQSAPEEIEDPFPHCGTTIYCSSVSKIRGRVQKEG